MLLLGDGQLQNAVFKLGGHLAGLHVLAYIEAAAASTGIALLANILALLVALILVQALGRLDGQIAVLQLHIDLILLEAGQIDIQLVAVRGLPHIGLHQVLAVLAVQRVVTLGHYHHTKGIRKEIIKQVLTKNARQHKSYLHSISGRPTGRTAELLLPYIQRSLCLPGGPLTVLSQGTTIS